MRSRKEPTAPAPGAPSADEQPTERPGNRPQRESELLKAFKIAYRTLVAIDRSAQHHDHGVTALGDMAAKARFEIEEMLQ